jgi:predicted dienelactone hydrolase
MPRFLALFAALLTTFSVHAAPPRAGELALSLPYPQAAPRGSAELRLLAWYPAAPEAEEREVTAGPVFVAGRVAQGAPWADAGRHPLVLLSHGFGGAARQMTWLGEALARAGYVAVAVDHPGTNGVDGITPVGAYAPWLRAADLSHVLDAVLAHPVLGAHVDRARIGVAGFSIGGWTAALLLGATADFERFRAFCRSPQRDAICNDQVEFPLNYERQHAELKAAGAEKLLEGETRSWRDPRVKAGLLIAPALVQALAPDSIARMAVPVRLVAGDADRVVPTPSNAQLLARLIPGARLSVLAGVGHYDFLSLCAPAGRQMAPALCEEPGPPRERTHAMTVEAALGFFAEALR